MAVDTRDKRSSAIAVSSPWRNRLPLPDSTVDQGDRQHTAYYYSGVLAILSITISGPCWAEGQVYHPEFKQGQEYLPGYREGEVYSPEFKQGEVIC